MEEQGKNPLTQLVKGKVIKVKFEKQLSPQKHSKQNTSISYPWACYLLSGHEEILL